MLSQSLNRPGCVQTTSLEISLSRSPSGDIDLVDVAIKPACVGKTDAELVNEFAASYSNQHGIVSQVVCLSCDQRRELLVDLAEKLVEHNKGIKLVVALTKDSLDEEHQRTLVVLLKATDAPGRWPKQGSTITQLNLEQDTKVRYDEMTLDTMLR